MSNTEKTYDVTSILNTDEDLFEFTLHTPKAIEWVKANVQIFPDMKFSETQFYVDDAYPLNDAIVKAGLSYNFDGNDMEWDEELGAVAVTVNV